MLRYFSALLVIVTLSGCCYLPSCDFLADIFCSGIPRGKSVKVIDSAEVSRAILVFSEKLKYEKGLHLEDSVIYYETHINRIRLDFSSMESLDLWESRELLVDVVEEFLNRLNGNGKITPYLRQRPFRASNLEVYIRFKTFFNVYVDLQYVGLITLRNGISNFIAQTGLDCDTDCWHRRSEYYFQTRNFVEFRRQGEALYKPRELSPDARSALEDERVFSMELAAPRFQRGR